MKKILSCFLRYGVSLLCLAYAFHGVPLAELWSVLRGYPVWPMVLSVLASFVAYAFLGARLMLMRTPRLRFVPCYCASLVGLALNNVLPAKAGELAMAAWVGREHGLPFDTSLGLVFMGRFFDVNALGLLSLWFLWALRQKRTALALSGCLVLGWGILLLFRRRPEWAKLWGKLPLPARVTDFLTRFTLSLVEQMSPRRLAWSAALTAVLWTGYAFQSWVSLNGVAGLGLSAGEVVGVFALSSLGMLLPSSPGALGVYEAVMATALAAYSVPRDQALAVTLFCHMAQFIPVTLAGGLLFLAIPGKAERAQ